MLLLKCLCMKQIRIMIQCHHYGGYASLVSLYMLQPLPNAVMPATAHTHSSQIVLATLADRRFVPCGLKHLFYTLSYMNRNLIHYQTMYQLLSVHQLVMHHISLTMLSKFGLAINYQLKFFPVKDFPTKLLLKVLTQLHTFVYVFLLLHMCTVLTLADFAELITLTTIITKVILSFGMQVCRYICANSLVPISDPTDMKSHIR